MSLFVPRQINNNVAIIPDLPGLGNGQAAAKNSGGHRSAPSNVYASTDNSILQKLDPNTLEPLGRATQADLHPDLKGLLSCAHAQRDPETGDVFNFNLDLGRRATYRIFRVNADSGTTDILATISDPDLPAAYIHSLFLTQNYVILCVPASHFAWRGIKILWERNIIDAIKPFDKSQRCKWLVVDRRRGRGIVARFSSPASFFFHSVNAFEETAKDDAGNEATSIHLDSVTYPNTDIMHMFYYDVLMNRDEAATKALVDKGIFRLANARLVRHKFTLPASPACPQSSGEDAYAQTAREVFSIPGPHSGELPVINATRAGKPYRYVYGVSSRGRSIFMDSIVKTDVETREALVWNGPVGHTPGEPIFVPRPGGAEEDDGVILSLVLDGSAQTSYLLCLDAQTFGELGRAETEFAIPLGLHGCHVSR
ncbi:hypothetical protein UVI_02050430 [Ustilaginoidea virens]|nr:hypothetical protein UVI_02050430 [Ustilaginoidea virens]